MNQEILLDRPDNTAQRTSSGYQSGSFLVRIWTETREVEGEPPRVRVFLRNLKTGQEHYLGDLDQLGEAVLRQFQQLEKE